MCEIDFDEFATVWKERLVHARKRYRWIDRNLCDGEHPEIFDDIDEMLETAVP